MMMKHNKKRNVGIIYEQLSQAFSEALVERNQKRAMLIKKIIDDHYHKDGEIFREFKIFNALLKVYVPSDSLATSILSEAKTATLSLNRKKLEIEKSLLIKDINYTLAEDAFYSRNISDYRNLATIQNLMNMWQKKSKDNLQRLAEYENKAHALLREEKNNNLVSDQINEEVNPLVLKIMQEKFQKKYNPILTESQSNLIQNYVFENDKKTLQLLKEIKAKVIKKAEQFNRECDNKILSEKSNRVMNQLYNLDENKIDDDNIAKFLLACKLSDQLGEKNE